MALLVGTNSWVTVAEADSYLEDMADVEDWFELSDDPVQRGEKSKANLLVTAFRWLMYNINLINLTASLTDQNVKNAQIEGALFLLRYQEDLERRGALSATGVTRIELSKWTETIQEMSLPSKILSLLNEYSSIGGRVIQLLGEDYTDGTVI